MYNHYVSLAVNNILFAFWGSDLAKDISGDTKRALAVLVGLAWNHSDMSRDVKDRDTVAHTGYMATAMIQIVLANDGRQGAAIDLDVLQECSNVLIRTWGEYLDAREKEREQRLRGIMAGLRAPAAG